jgi:hypothetical protein
MINKWLGNKPCAGGEKIPGDNSPPAMANTDSVLLWQSGSQWLGHACFSDARNPLCYRRANPPPCPLWCEQGSFGIEQETKRPPDYCPFRPHRLATHPRPNHGQGHMCSASAFPLDVTSRNAHGLAVNIHRTATERITRLAHIQRTCVSQHRHHMHPPGIAGGAGKAQLYLGPCTRPAYPGALCESSLPAPFPAVPWWRHGEHYPPTDPLRGGKAAEIVAGRVSAGQSPKISLC